MKRIDQEQVSKRLNCAEKKGTKKIDGGSMIRGLEWESGHSTRASGWELRGQRMKHGTTLQAAKDHTTKEKMGAFGKMLMRRILILSGCELVLTSGPRKETDRPSLQMKSRRESSSALQSGHGERRRVLTVTPCDKFRNYPHCP